MNITPFNKNRAFHVRMSRYYPSRINHESLRKTLETAKNIEPGMTNILRAWRLDLTIARQFCLMDCDLEALFVVKLRVILSLFSFN